MVHTHPNGFASATRLATVVAVVVVGASAWLNAQPTTAGATAPVATAPAATARARHQITVPPGFQKVTVGFRTALCEPADEAWVKRVLGTVDPPQQPTTMPADLIDRVAQKRALLKARVAADLALGADTAALDQFFDQRLLPELAALRDLAPPMFYLVCSRERLRDLVKSGAWSDPRFYYNRAADDVAYNSDMRLSADGGIDDMAMPAIYPHDAPPDVRERTLSNTVRRGEAAVIDAVSKRAMIVTQLAMIDFIGQNAVQPLKLKLDQMWFGMGIEAVLSSRYAAELTGMRADDVLDRMTRDDPRNPVRAATVDLLRPADASSMRPEWVPAYNDAFRVKATRVVRQLLNQSGETGVSMALVAFRATPPPDGPALLKMIKVSTGVDLADAVKPRQ